MKWPNVWNKLNYFLLVCSILIIYMQQNKSVKKEFNTLEFSLALILNVNMCKIINALNKKNPNINKQKHKNKRSHSLNKGGNFMHYKGACSTIDIL